MVSDVGGEVVQVINTQRRDSFFSHEINIPPLN